MVEKKSITKKEGVESFGKMKTKFGNDVWTDFYFYNYVEGFKNIPVDWFAKTPITNCGIYSIVEHEAMPHIPLKEWVHPLPDREKEIDELYSGMD